MFETVLFLLIFRGSATFARQDLWKSDLSKYDNVVIFGVEQMVRKNYFLCLENRSDFLLLSDARIRNETEPAVEPRENPRRGLQVSFSDVEGTEDH